MSRHRGTSKHCGVTEGKAARYHDGAFRVVEGQFRKSCGCIHFPCAYCPNEASIKVPRSGLPEYFSVMCNETPEGKLTFMVHWDGTSL